jgi:hypothetical protein
MDTQAPSLARSVSIQGQGKIVDARPRRQLSRRDSERESRLNPQVFTDRWQTGPFADVPEKKSWNMVKHQVFTLEHQQLIGRMRLEGARISQELAESRRQVTLLEKRNTELSDRLQNARSEVRMLQRYADSLKQELHQSQEVFRDLDAIHAITKERRHSRLLLPPPSPTLAETQLVQAMGSHSRSTTPEVGIKRAKPL